jgi:NAD(P)-dependent dehydrogenase (short-subunit alcohol dehydrogenase family)
LAVTRTAKKIVRLGKLYSIQIKLNINKQTTIMSTKIALVTGANKGLGLGAVRTLANDHGFHVILAARNPTLGEAAVAQLHKEGLKNVEFLQLDVSNKESIKAAAVAFKSKHQGIDLLINNAGN